jgi:predicted esterase
MPNGGTLNLTFKSRIDGSLQPVLLKTPKGYTPEKSWPLLVTLHGLGDGPILANEIESIVQIGPNGRGPVWFTGPGEEDVFECLDMARKLFSVDEDRIYLCGFSMGGAATFGLGLRRPDMWAACVPVCGSCDDLDSVENGEHVAFWINTGEKDMTLSPKYSHKAYLKARELGFSNWKYTEHKDLGHRFDIDWKEVEQWLLNQKRTVNPKKVTFCTRTLAANRAHWVEVTGIKKYGRKARIEAAVKEQKIHIKTDNVSNYTLHLNDKLLDLAETVEIVENGERIFRGLLKDGCFVKDDKSGDVVRKRPGLSGPLWDIYAGACLLAYGTKTEDKSLIEAARSCAESFLDPPWMNKVSFRMAEDTAVTDEDIKEKHLVLFGNAETNKLLADIADKLPIRINGNSIAAGDKEYSGKNIGYVLIWPNPANREKYVAVFAGNSAEAIDCFCLIWPTFKSGPRGVDYGVFELIGDDEAVKWHTKGLFGTQWTWQAGEAEP